MLSIYGWGISLEIAHRCLSQHFTDYKSTLVQVMAWCRQATSHYLSQCCPRSLSPYDVTRPQWVKQKWMNLEGIPVNRVIYVICIICTEFGVSLVQNKQQISITTNNVQSHKKYLTRLRKVNSLKPDDAHICQWTASLFQAMAPVWYQAITWTNTDLLSHRN